MGFSSSNFASASFGVAGVERQRAPRNHGAGGSLRSTPATHPCRDGTTGIENPRYPRHPRWPRGRTSRSEARHPAVAFDAACTVEEDFSGCPAGKPDRRTVKVSLVYSDGNLCAARAVNLLMKMVSVRSRPLPEPADTVFDPWQKRHVTRHVSGARQVPDGVFSSQGVARPAWRNTVPAAGAAHLRPPATDVPPESVLTHGRTRPCQPVCAAVCCARSGARAAVRVPVPAVESKGVVAR